MNFKQMKNVYYLYNRRFSRAFVEDPANTPSCLQPNHFCS